MEEKKVGLVSEKEEQCEEKECEFLGSIIISLKY